MITINNIPKSLVVLIKNEQLSDRDFENVILKIVESINSDKLQLTNYSNEQLKKFYRTTIVKLLPEDTKIKHVRQIILSNKVNPLLTLLNHYNEAYDLSECSKYTIIAEMIGKYDARDIIQTVRSAKLSPKYNEDLLSMLFNKFKEKNTARLINNNLFDLSNIHVTENFTKDLFKHIFQINPELIINNLESYKFCENINEFIISLFLKNSPRLLLDNMYYFGKLNISTNLTKEILSLLETTPLSIFQIVMKNDLSTETYSDYTIFIINNFLKNNNLPGWNIDDDYLYDIILNLLENDLKGIKSTILMECVPFFFKAFSKEKTFSLLEKLISRLYSPLLLLNDETNEQLVKIKNIFESKDFLEYNEKNYENEFLDFFLDRIKTKNSLTIDDFILIRFCSYHSTDNKQIKSLMKIDKRIHVIWELKSGTNQDAVINQIKQCQDKIINNNLDDLDCLFLYYYFFGFDENYPEVNIHFKKTDLILIFKKLFSLNFSKNHFVFMNFLSTFRTFPEPLFNYKNLQCLAENNPGIFSDHLEYFFKTVNLEKSEKITLIKKAISHDPFNSDLIDGFTALFKDERDKNIILDFINTYREFYLKKPNKKSINIFYQVFDNQLDLLLKRVKAISLLLSMKELDFISQEKTLTFDEIEQKLASIFIQKLDLQNENIDDKDIIKLSNSLRDPYAIFTYLNKIVLLDEFANPILLNTYKNIILAILKGNYKEYKKANSPHYNKLKEIIGSDILNKWEIGYNEKISSKSIQSPEEMNIETTNFKNYLIERLITYKHIDKLENRFPSLLSYLKDEEDIEIIISNLNEKLKDKPQQNHKIEKVICNVCKQFNKGDLTKLSKLLSNDTTLTIFRDDIAEFSRIISLKTSKGKQLIFSDTDDFSDILQLGHETGGCQNINGDQNLNMCLLGYCDWKNRIWSIKEKMNNGNHRLVGRCVARFLWSEVDKKPYIFLEPYYSLNPDPKIKDILYSECKKRAKNIRVELIHSDQMDQKTKEKKLVSYGCISNFEYCDTSGGITDGHYIIGRSLY